MTDQPVSQEAREAAAAVRRKDYPDLEGAGEGISAGQYDKHYIVQAFHRFESAIRAGEVPHVSIAF